MLVLSSDSEEEGSGEEEEESGAEVSGWAGRGLGGARVSNKRGGWEGGQASGPVSGSGVADARFYA